jgi:hypothetical protein
MYSKGQVTRGPEETYYLLLDYVTNHISATVKELNIFSP